MASTALPLIGIVLAGGRSSRMGRDKALLRWRGQTLLDHQLETLRLSGVDQTCVSGRRPEHNGIADPQPGAGPLGGLAGVAAAIQEDVNLLIVPVDMPLLSPELLRRLGHENPAASCLRFAGKILPVRLRLDRTARSLLQQRLEAERPGERSLHALQRDLNAAELALDETEADQFVDCNTPAVWQEIGS